MTSSTSVGGSGLETPALEPFFQLTETHERSPLRHVRALWPIVVLLVVLAFFAVAGLSR